MCPENQASLDGVSKSRGAATGRRQLNKAAQPGTLARTADKSINYN